MTPEKLTGLIYQLLFNYFAATNTGLKKTFIIEKIVHFGVLNTIHCRDIFPMFLIYFFIIIIIVFCMKPMKTASTFGSLNATD